MNIIGQENVLDRIVTSIKSAEKLSLPPPNWLFIGPAGTGKTQLAEEISAITGYQICSVNAASIANISKLIEILSEYVLSDEIYEQPELITSKYPLIAGLKIYSRPLNISNKINHSGNPFILYLDEIHGATKRLQNELLTFITNGIITTTIKKTPTTHYYSNICFVASTTSGSSLSEALRRRFINIYVGYPDDINKYNIVKSLLDKTTIKITHNDIFKLSAICTTQASCVSVVERLVEWSNCYSDGILIDLSKFFIYMDLSPEGFDRNQRSALIILAGTINPIASHTMASLLNLSLKDYEILIEQILLKKGLCEIITSGRLITPAGRKLVQEWCKNS